MYVAIPLRFITWKALSSKGEIPGRGYPPRPNTRIGCPPAARAGGFLRIKFMGGAAHPRQIPGRRYPLEVYYLGGDAPSNRIPEIGPLPQGKYHDSVTPSGSSTCTGPYHPGRIPGRAYPIKAEFRGSATHSDQIPEIGCPHMCQIQNGVIL